jgi:hypothetical protein
VRPGNRCRRSSLAARLQRAARLLRRCRARGSIRLSAAPPQKMSVLLLIISPGGRLDQPTSVVREVATKKDAAAEPSAGGSHPPESGVHAIHLCRHHQQKSDPDCSGSLRDSSVFSGAPRRSLGSVSSQAEAWDGDSTGHRPLDRLTAVRSFRAVRQLPGAELPGYEHGRGRRWRRPRLPRRSSADRIPRP